MAEQETEIVFEMPDDMPDVEENEVELTEEAPKAKQKAEEAPQEEFDFEIEDDTPPEDRGRDPLPKEIVEELEKDTLDDYSERVKQRLSQMKKVWHDERREKERYDRERQEAIRVAQAIMNENKRLKSTLSAGEGEYVRAVHSALEQQFVAAQRDYKEAYDAGDTDRIINAQARMNDAQFKLASLQNYQPQFQNALQEEENPVYIQPSQPQVPEISQKDRSWQAKNDWFGKNRQMTSFALGLHEDLVEEGVPPGSDEYYRRVDSTMQKRFPEYFGDATLDEEKPAHRKSTVVAPATRSTAPKKVRLSKTQVALAKKFGLTPEQYARELTKLETK